MKVVYHGESSPLELIDGKEYEVVSIEGDWYRIVDETDEDYLFPPECFEISEPNDGTTLVLSLEEAKKRSHKQRAQDDNLFE